MRQVWFVYQKRGLGNAAVYMYGDFIGGHGDCPGHWSPYHWKVKANYLQNGSVHEREWIFSLSLYPSETEKSLKRKVLSFCDSLNSEKKVIAAVNGQEVLL